MKTIIGIDFSISKPAACVFSNNNYYFYLWPKNLPDKNYILLSDAGVSIMPRYNIESSDLVRFDLINSDILSDLIINSLSTFLNKNTYISIEGASFGSKGNMMISLITWKYTLLHKLNKIIPVDNIYTYSPITIKSIAGCAKKGMKKFDMINSFIEKGDNCDLQSTLSKNTNLYKKKNSSNYIDGLDDVIDSYFILKTLQIKENL